MDALSLYELNNLVRQSIHGCFPEEYWVQAELSDVRSNPNGHCYLEFIQKDPRNNALLAKARGTIWANSYRLIRPYFEKETGQSLVSGLKVLVKVTIDFHELYGYNLTVVDIDPTYTVGDMAKRRKEIIRQLEMEGVLNLNKELELPLLLNRIAIISSPTAAGYGDFADQLNKNPYGFVFYTRLFPAVMQGERVEETIIDALNVVNNERDNWDAVVIIRGGGATSDLSGFDTYLLAANCAQFPLPIITGIGHERDDTVLDTIAHTRVKTPTAAAEFLINHMRLTAQQLEDYTSFIVSSVSLRMEYEKNKLNGLSSRIPSAVNVRIVEVKYKLNFFQQQLKNLLANRFIRETHRLELIAGQLHGFHPDNILKLGYSITLKDGKAITDSKQLEDGDEVTTRLWKGEVKSKILKS